MIENTNPDTETQFTFKDDGTKDSFKCLINRKPFKKIGNIFLNYTKEDLYSRRIFQT